MTETNDTEDQKPAGGRTLSLRRTTTETGLVRQNFPHGRSKTVVVETKKRKLKVGAPGAKSASPAAEQVSAPKPRVARPQENNTQAPAAQAPSGTTARQLTDEEREARDRALAEARVRDSEDRKRAIEEEKNRAEREAIEAAEREAAAARQAEEDAKRKADEEKRRKAEAATVALEEAEIPASPGRAQPDEGDDTSKSRKSKRGGAGDAKPAPSRTKADQERRRGKLTISNALDSDEERSRSLASYRRRMERQRKQSSGFQPSTEKIAREVTIPEVITIQELANRMAERAVDVIKLLMKQGQMLKINDVVDADTAQLIAEELGHTVKRVSESDVEEGLMGETDDEGDMLPRAPIVTVMGHVDHGKTSLLDAMRNASVAAGEAGGITQHIGAYQVETPGGIVTFIDTPGHAAFTAMRARGAKATDIVVLVVAADDGVMPQTIEAINHARAAEVPIIVAINKIDKPDADPNRARTDLLSHEVVVESMSGDVLDVEVSAIKGTNLDKLLEAILLQAELLELKANPYRPADGIIVEAQLDKGRGPVATLLVQRGTLKIGDIVVAGTSWGKVRALINDKGDNIESAGPSVPVEVLGLNAAPEAGDHLVVVENEARAREITEYRDRKRREARGLTGARTSLEQMMSQLKDVGTAEFPVLVKADVQGSAEAIVQALEKVGNDEVSARVIHYGVGGISESDVQLAKASGAIIVGFDVRANNQARQAAELEGVEIRYYTIIYDLVDDMKAAMSGLLSPELRETFLGNAEILEVFNISKVGKVAGCRVSEGQVQRGARVRLIRDNVVIHDGTLSTLKRFKDEVKDVQAGQECGMAFENYQDMRAGDVIEAFLVEEVERSLA